MILFHDGLDLRPFPLVILPETDTAGARLVAERVRQGLEEARVTTEAGSLGVTGSFGVATNVSSQIADAASLISAADGALYRAKHAGRNRVEICTSEE